MFYPTIPLNTLQYEAEEKAKPGTFNPKPMFGDERNGPKAILPSLVYSPTGCTPKPDGVLSFAVLSKGPSPVAVDPTTGSARAVAPAGEVVVVVQRSDIAKKGQAVVIVRSACTHLRMVIFPTNVIALNSQAPSSAMAGYEPARCVPPKPNAVMVLSSDDPVVAGVRDVAGGQRGFIEPHAPGQARISVKVEGFAEVSADVTVVDEFCTGASVRVIPESVIVGERAHAVATFTPTGCTPNAPTKASLSNSTASIDKSGNIVSGPEPGAGSIELCYHIPTQLSSRSCVRASFNVERVPECKWIDEFEYTASKILVGSRTVRPSISYGAPQASKCAVNGATRFSVEDNDATVDPESGIVSAGQKRAHVRVTAQYKNSIRTAVLEIVDSPCPKYKSHIKWLLENIAEDQKNGAKIQSAVETDLAAVPAAIALVEKAKQYLRTSEAGEPKDHNTSAWLIWNRYLGASKDRLNSAMRQLQFLKDSPARHKQELQNLEDSIARDNADLRDTREKLETDAFCKGAQ